jgi:DNA-directed RNA polymerase subunit K/omega
VALKPVDIESGNPNIKGIYEAIVAAAKRARQIHNDVRIELNQQLETLAQLTTAVDPEDETDVSANPDQLKISLEFERKPKPTEAALEELLQNRIEWKRREVEKPVEVEKPAEETESE